MVTPEELKEEYSKLKERYIMESGLGDEPLPLLNRIEMFELYYKYYLIMDSVVIHSTKTGKSHIMDNNQH